MIELFTVGDDYLIDQQLLPYDIKASIAHAQMLEKINVLSKAELKKTEQGLNEILKLWKKDKFTISQDQEDGHTAIEQYLTQKFGKIGKKIHTGRSRNDQSLVMVRLFIKDNLEIIERSTKKLIQEFNKKISQSKQINMPGYTHMQKAMPTTVATWLDSYLASLKDFLIQLNTIKKIINQNPLGSASGFGIKNFTLDRNYTTKKLNFKKIQKNPMYCGFSRGYFENIVLQNLSPLMIIFGRFATDMMIFTTQEFDFFKLPNNFTTGSSIMPQKKNYDIFEIMIGNTKVFHSYQNQIQKIISSLGSGYHRDLQLTKKPFVLGINLCKNSIGVATLIIKNLKYNTKNLNKSMTSDLYITNKVYELVKKGYSFRQAYIKIKKDLNNK